MYQFLCIGIGVVLYSDLAGANGLFMSDRSLLNLTSPSPRYGSKKKLRHILATSEAISRIDALAVQFSVSRSELVELLGRAYLTLTLPVTRAASPSSRDLIRHAAWVTDDGWAGIKKLAAVNGLSLKDFFAQFECEVILDKVFP